MPAALGQRPCLDCLCDLELGLSFLECLLYWTRGMRQHKKALIDKAVDDVLQELADLASARPTATQGLA